MDAPTRFGHPDAGWAPSESHEPREVIGLWLQHRIVAAIRAQVGVMPVREMARRAGVSKSTMGRWLAGTELLNVSALGVLASAFGLDVLSALTIAGDPVELLPEPYRPLANFHDGVPTFIRPNEPAWRQLAAAIADLFVSAGADGSTHLLTTPAVAYALGRAANELPPTRGLVDLVPANPGMVRFGLEESIDVAITIVGDGPAVEMRRTILSALRGAWHVEADARAVTALTLHARGRRILEQILSVDAASGAATITSTTFARAGLGDPIGPDVSVTTLAERAVAGGCVQLLEIRKGI